MLKHQHSVVPIFVYGTLMIGERNYIDVLHNNLTHHENAKVRGTLYYYREGDYPALMEGNQWVRGQLFYVDQLSEVLLALDKIEGFIESNHPDNMYERKIIEVVTDSGEVLQAYSYLINPNLFIKKCHEFSLIESHSWKEFKQI